MEVFMYPIYKSLKFCYVLYAFLTIFLKFHFPTELWSLNNNYHHSPPLPSTLLWLNFVQSTKNNFYENVQNIKYWWEGVIPTVWFLIDFPQFFFFQETFFKGISIPIYIYFLNFAIKETSAWLYPDYVSRLLTQVVKFISSISKLNYNRQFGKSCIFFIPLFLWIFFFYWGDGNMNRIVLGIVFINSNCHHFFIINIGLFVNV